MTTVRRLLERATAETSIRHVPSFQSAELAQGEHSRGWNVAEGAGADSSRELGDGLAHMRVRVLHVESILRVAILRDSGATMFPLVIAASCPAGSM